MAASAMIGQARFRTLPFVADTPEAGNNGAALPHERDARAHIATLPLKYRAGTHILYRMLWRRSLRRGRDRGHFMGWLQNKFEKNFMITTVDYVFNWARKSAVWPMTFGLACCAIEMIASSTARFDIARFGSEVFRPSPRQSDLMIVAGTVTLKMAPVVKRIYDQMPDPKWVISMGACSSVGGPFNTYAVLQGVDKIVPTDVYVIGCPPRPENLFYALLKLQDKIDQMSLAKRPTEVRLDPHHGGEFQTPGDDRADAAAEIVVSRRSSVVSAGHVGTAAPAVLASAARQSVHHSERSHVQLRKTCRSIRTSSRGRSQRISSGRQSHLRCQC